MYDDEDVREAMKCADLIELPPRLIELDEEAHDATEEAAR